MALQCVDTQLQFPAEKFAGTNGWNGWNGLNEWTECSYVALVVAVGRTLCDSQVKTAASAIVIDRVV